MAPTNSCGPGLNGIDRVRMANLLRFLPGGLRAIPGLVGAVHSSSIAEIVWMDYGSFVHLPFFLLQHDLPRDAMVHGNFHEPVELDLDPVVGLAVASGYDGAGNSVEEWDSARFQTSRAG